jgi:5-methylcytosine-specific restriction endonuclease McrA
MTPTKPAMPEHCELCGRDRPLTFHHLIPRQNHRRGAFLRRFDKDDMTHRGAWLCRDCHRMLHKTFDARTLGLELNTIESIRAHPDVQKFVAWVRKKR